MAQFRPLLTSDPGPRFEQCKEAALRLLDRAAVGWGEGDPSDPDPKVVLEQIIDIFVQEHFLRRPAGAGKRSGRPVPPRQVSSPLGRPGETECPKPAVTSR
jgi:hypothetical protein